MTHNIVRFALLFGWLLLAVLPAFAGQEGKQAAKKPNSGMATSSTQCLGKRIVSSSEAFSIPLTECGSPVGR